MAKPKRTLARKMPRNLQMAQRNRDIVTGQLTLDYFIQKAAEGWKLAAIEWVREEGDEIPASSPMVHLAGDEVPYGLRISADGLYLESNPVERTVLLLLLDRIVHEKRITEIARELNDEGYRTRRDSQWTAAAVFELLPRLIEAGPGLLKSTEWRTLRAGGSV